MKASDNINPLKHPNLEFEDDIKALQNIIEIGNCTDDYEKLNSLSIYLFIKKFDNNDISIMNKLNEKYLIKVKL